MNSDDVDHSRTHADPNLVRPTRSPVVALLVSLRPRQWLKNALVLAVPLSAGRILEPGVLGPTAVAFVAFCLASSSTYLINDASDVEVDRRHPTKKFRPQASGEVSRSVALATATVLAVIALVLGFATTRALGWSVAAYLVLTLLYTLRLKHEPVVELALLTSGFLLRATAGGAATGIPVSNWFLIVAGFGSLFMAVGKRYSEIMRPDRDPSTRRSLAGYSPEFLRWAAGVSAAVAICAYCIWAFEVAADTPSTLPWAELSVIPFVMGVLRYGLRITSAEAEAPEEAVLGDRALIVIGFVWAATFALGAYGA